MADRGIETDDAGAPEHPIEIDTKRARGAGHGVPVLYVLIAGIVLVIVAFLIIYFFLQPHTFPPHPAS